MKFIKLILLFLFVMTFTSLFAAELLEPDNAVTVPDIEPLKIDLEAIKNKSKFQQNVSRHEKKNSKIKPAKAKTSKSKALKKKSGSKKTDIKKKKTDTGPVKKADKSVKDGKKLSSKPVVKKMQVEKIKQATDEKNNIKTVESDTNHKVPGQTENKFNPVIIEPDNKAVDTAKKEIVQTPVNMIIINPLYNSDTSTNRLYKIDYAAITKWAKPLGLKVKEDAPPVIDGIAFYIPDFFADFKAEGYDRSREYKLYIDFVRFDGETKYINSLLKIWGRDVAGKMYLIAEINSKILREDKIFETIIPYELSSPGTFDIIVREYSDTPGKWGIWDMIITDKRVDRIEIIKPDASEKMKEIEPKIFK